MKLRVINRDGQRIRAGFYCPACEEMHYFNLEFVPDQRPVWNFNGDEKSPTFTPSFLRHGDQWTQRCHLFVSGGQIQYCADSGHALAGKTIELPDIPEEFLAMFSENAGATPAPETPAPAPADPTPAPAPEAPVPAGPNLPPAAAAPEAPAPSAPGDFKQARPLAEDEVFVEFANGRAVRGKFVRWHPAREGFLQIVITEEMEPAN